MIYVEPAGTCKEYQTARNVVPDADDLPSAHHPTLSPEGGGAQLPHPSKRLPSSLDLSYSCVDV